MHANYRLEKGRKESGKGSGKGQSKGQSKGQGRRVFVHVSSPLVVDLAPFVIRLGGTVSFSDFMLVGECSRSIGK